VLSGRCLCDGLVTCTHVFFGYLSVVCCVLSGRGLCDGLIPFTKESCGCLSVV